MGLQCVIRKCLRLKILTTKLFSSGALFVEPLEKRTLLRVTGNEVHDYLQGLITNDMNNLAGVSECMYAMFLNGKGRVLYDTIIYKADEPDTYLIEGDSSASLSLKKHLLTYRVRRNICVESADDLKLWVAGRDFDENISEASGMTNLSSILKSLLGNCVVCSDPRIICLGLRIIAPKEMNVISALKQLSEFQVTAKNFYKSLRYKLGVGEGTTELPPGQSFPLEANCDYLCGVSFEKGCYIGQELTARTYHTGVVRKRIMPITFLESINSNAVNVPIVSQRDELKSIGKLRGIEGMTGIALLRIEEALNSPKLTVLDKHCITGRPFWWPKPN